MDSLLNKLPKGTNNMHDESGSMSVKNILDVISKHHSSAKIDYREVNSGVKEYEGLATPELVADMKGINYQFEFFYANNKNHSDYGMRCLKFTVFDADVKDLKA